MLYQNTIKKNTKKIIKKKKLFIKHHICLQACLNFDNPSRGSFLPSTRFDRACRRPIWQVKAMWQWNLEDGAYLQDHYKQHGNQTLKMGGIWQSTFNKSFPLENLWFTKRLFSGTFWVKNIVKGRGKRFSKHLTHFFGRERKRQWIWCYIKVSYCKKKNVC